MEQLFSHEILKNIIALAHGIFGSVAHAAITLPDPANIAKQNIGQFFVSLYSLAIGLVGFAVFVQFTRAGLTYLFSAGNASETSNAKHMMQNAVLGAILLIASYTILNVINPNLTKLSFGLPDLGPVPSYSVDLPKPLTTTIDDPKQARIALGNVGITSGDVDLTGITKFTVGQLEYIKRLCECDVEITEFADLGNRNVLRLKAHYSENDYGIAYNPYAKSLYNSVQGIANGNIYSGDPVIIKGQRYVFDKNTDTFIVSYAGVAK